MVLDIDTSIRTISYVNRSVWACGVKKGTFLAEAFCIDVDSLHGIQQGQYWLEWTDISYSEQVPGSLGIATVGMLTRESSSAAVAICAKEDAQLSCAAQIFSGSTFAAGSIVPAVDKMVYIGKYGSMASVTIVDNTLDAVSRSFLYSSGSMETVTFSRVESSPNYIGSFVVGTYLKNDYLTYILAGVLRTDSGTMSAMYVAPIGGNIVNRRELVNAMALEYVNPNSFIAGGLQLAGDSGMNAYLLCVNSIFRQVVFGVRYRVRGTVSAARRRFLLSEDKLSSASVVKGMVLVDNTIYLVVSYNESLSFKSRSFLAILKVDMTTGTILQQAQIISEYASILCAGIDVDIAEQFFAIACNASYGENNATQAVVISVNRALTFSKLPMGFSRNENDTFLPEPIAFKRSFLPLDTKSFDHNSEKLLFTAANENPTLLPSLAPSGTPSLMPSNAASSQPTSCPTAAPSVSPQPTSHPSSSGPTNTYKPTAKPTQRPSNSPTRGPTESPSKHPTAKPMVRPSAAPSVSPSAQPSVTPTIKPTRHPTLYSTRVPSTLPTVKSSTAPTDVPTVSVGVKPKQPRVNHALTIIGYVVAGLSGLFLLYCLCRWCAYMLDGVQCDANRAQIAESMGTLPKPRSSIFSCIVRLFVIIKPVRGNLVTGEEPPEGFANKRAIKMQNTLYSGVGANIEGPTGFRDLEGNTFSSISQVHPSGGARNRTNRHAVESDSQSDVDVVLSEESSYFSESSHVYSVPDFSGSDGDRESTLSEEGEDDGVDLSEESMNSGDYPSPVWSDAESSDVEYRMDSSDDHISSAENDDIGDGISDSNGSANTASMGNTADMLDDFFHTV